MNELIQKIVKTLIFYKKRLNISFRSLLYDLNPRILERPIFIIGCSRSGTTLVYKTFSTSISLGSLHKETHDFWVKLHPLSERDWNTHAIDPSLANDSDRSTVSNFFYINTGKYRVVDKNNQNGLSVKYLFSLFPDAQFIYIKRNPGDNIDSLINGWKKADEFATWSNDLPSSVEIENGEYRKWCFFLANGWRTFTKQKIEDVCAFQYESINRAILEAKNEIPPIQWHEIFYENLISNPADEFRKLFTACDIPFDTKLEQHCRQVLNIPYNTFSPIGVYKWKKGLNGKRIERILPRLKVIANEMGYTNLDN